MYVNMYVYIYIYIYIYILTDPGPPVGGRVLAQVARRLHLWGAGGSS